MPEWGFRSNKFHPSLRYTCASSIEIEIMTHIEKLHLEAINNSKFEAPYSPIPQIAENVAAKKSAEITEQISCEFAIFFSGVIPILGKKWQLEITDSKKSASIMNCKDIIRQDLPHEEKVKLIFQEYLNLKKNDTRRTNTPRS